MLDVLENCQKNLNELVRQLRRHGFNVQRCAKGGVDESGAIRTPILTLRGGLEEATRLTDLVISFYDHDGPPNADVELRVFDQDLDSSFEFDFRGAGSEVLVLLPRELIPPGSREQIVRRYRREFAKFERFLRERAPDDAG